GIEQPFREVSGTSGSAQENDSPVTIAGMDGKLRRRSSESIPSTWYNGYALCHGRLVFTGRNRSPYTRRSMFPLSERLPQGTLKGNKPGNLQRSNARCGPGCKCGTCRGSRSGSQSQYYGNACASCHGIGPVV